MTRLPGCALQVRGRVTGFFDRTSLSCRKTGRIHAATLRAFLHPPAASYGDPGGKSQKPKANAESDGPVRLFCRSALVRDQPTERYTLAPRSRTSALLQGGGRPVDDGSMSPVGSLWERTLCATNLRSGTPSVTVAHRVRSHRQAKRQARHESITNGPKPMRSEALL